MKILKENQSLIEEYEKMIKNLQKENLDLEKRFQIEVEKSREKDHILIQQSRLAAMGEMVANIGHQWRHPLNSLSSLIHDVKEALEFGEINEHYIDRFIRESMVQIQHMSQTINDFRKFYRPNKEICAFSLADSIEDALAIFSSSLRNHDIKVEFEYRGQPLAYGFPNEFSQAVLNILTNARDAFVAKGIKNRILQINISSQGRLLSAEFTDNAGGFDPSFVHKMFDAYFTTRQQGTGLGLYMTKTILENMGGTVTAENVENGARFSLSVPKVTAQSIAELVSVS